MKAPMQPTRRGVTAERAGGEDEPCLARAQDNVLIYSYGYKTGHILAHTRASHSWPRSRWLLARKHTHCTDQAPRWREPLHPQELSLRCNLGVRLERVTRSFCVPTLVNRRPCLIRLPTGYGGDHHWQPGVVGTSLDVRASVWFTPAAASPCAVDDGNAFFRMWCVYRCETPNLDGAR